VVIQHVLVRNASSLLSKQDKYKNFNPCALIDFRGTNSSKITIGNNPLIQARKMGYFDIYLKDIDGSLMRQSLIYHFNNILEFSRLARQYIGQQTNKKANSSLIIDLYKKTLESANQIDIAELNRIYPGFGNRLDIDLVNGLELMIEGMETVDLNKFQKGQVLFLSWEYWLGKNLEKIKKIFILKK